MPCRTQRRAVRSSAIGIAGSRILARTLAELQLARGRLGPWVVAERDLKAQSAGFGRYRVNGGHGVLNWLVVISYFSFADPYRPHTQ